MAEENVEIVRRQWDAWMEDDPYVLGDMSFIDSEVVYEDALLPDHSGEAYLDTNEALEAAGLSG